MKLLIDENLPHGLRLKLIGHECFTVVYMTWSGIGNGKLLQLAADDDFDALITNDRGLEYQQNQSSLPVAVIVLLADDNKSATIARAVPQILEALKQLQPRSLNKIEVDSTT